MDSVYVGTGVVSEAGVDDDRLVLHAGEDDAGPAGDALGVRVEEVRVVRVEVVEFGVEGRGDEGGGRPRGGEVAVARGGREEEERGAVLGREVVVQVVLALCQLILELKSA